MKFTEAEKVIFLKAFTTLLKEAKGKGPKNIYIKNCSDEVHIVINGLISNFENYLINNFGDEAIDILTDFYVRDAKNIENHFLSILDDTYKLEFYELDSDFIEDLFIYKMKIKQ